MYKNGDIIYWYRGSYKGQIAIIILGDRYKIIRKGEETEDYHLASEWYLETQIDNIKKIKNNIGKILYG